MQPYEGRTFMEIVPHNTGLIVAGRYYEEVTKDYRGQAFWVQGDHTRLFSEWRANSDPPLSSAQHHDPAGRKLLFQAPDSLTRGFMQYWFLDLDSCAGAGICALQDLPGWPVWSPDGRSSLIMQENLSNLFVPQETQLWRGDADGQIIAEIGTGYAPFWLDGQTYGYVRVGANGHGEIVTAAVNDDAPQLLLTIEGLFGRLPGPDSPLPAFIANVQVNPANPGTLLITILRENDTILVHIERGDRRVLIVNDASVFTAFSPNGRMIILDKPLDQTGRRVLTLTHNLTEFGQQIVPTNGNSINYDWTADSQWLLISHPGFLKLVTPGRNYFQLVPHEFGTCERVEWVQ
jgi:hypothetical protein